MPTLWLVSFAEVDSVYTLTLASSLHHLLHSPLNDTLTDR